MRQVCETGGLLSVMLDCTLAAQVLEFSINSGRR